MGGYVNEVLKEIQKNELKKNWRSRWFHYGFALIFFELLTGTFLLLNTQLNFIAQFFLLFHLLLGFLLIVSLVAFIQRFFLYKRFWQDSLFSFLGQSIIASFLTSLASGTVLFFTGITGLKWLWFVHLISSYALTLVLCCFALLVVRRTQAELSDKMRSAFLKTVRKVSIKIAISSAVIIFIPLVLGFIYAEPDVTTKPRNYSLPFGPNPFFPGAVKTKENQFYKKEVFANSLSCGTTGCHQGIGRQWEESTHFRTPNPFVDAVQKLMILEGEEGRLFDQIQNDHIKKLNSQKLGRETFRKCAACHAPVALVAGNIDPSIPFDTDKNFEGVSCTLCHSIESAGTKGGGDYVVNPQSQYLFSYSQNALGQYLHNALIKNKPQLHKESYSKPFYKETGYCISCHERLHFKSWNESSYNNKKHPEQTKHCQSCHMPQVHEADEISAKEKGTIADHRFLSGGLSMARYFGKHEQFKKTSEFLKDKKIDLKIIAPSHIKAGELQTIIVRNANVGIGHNFPAGPEADIVEGWVYLKVQDSSGKIHFESGKLKADNHLDRNSTFIYHSVPYDGTGANMGLGRHRSWRFVEDRHQVIRPRMFHDIQYRLIIPKSVTGQLFIEAELNYRKPNQEFADWVLGKGKFLVPHVQMDTDKVTVQITVDSQKVENAKTSFNRELALLNLPGDIKKMQTFPEPDYQLDVEAKIVLFEAYGWLKKKQVKKAIATIETLGESAKKTKAYKDFYQRLNSFRKRKL